MADRLLPIPEVVLPGFRLGRHVRHDPRSLQYKVPARQVTPKSIRHARHIPILDQNTAAPGGKGVGSCTCHTAIDILGSDPFYDTLPPEIQAILNDQTAVDLYREVTRTDDFDGAWEPDDTGSAEVYVGRVLKARGWISGYQAATTIDEAHIAIQSGPFGVGSMWLSGMDTPDREGIVRATGQVRGGHEYTCDEYDAARDLWGFANHWTRYWGLEGRFYYDTPTLEKLMGMQGDMTVFVPLTQPAPQPTPAPAEPTPAPAPAPEDVFADFPVKQVKPWMGGRRTYTQRESTARTALAGWFASKGFDL